MINLLILRSETEVRTTYHMDEEEDMRKEKDCNTKGSCLESRYRNISIKYAGGQSAHTIYIQ